MSVDPGGHVVDYKIGPGSVLQHPLPAFTVLHHVLVLERQGSQEVLSDSLVVAEVHQDGLSRQQLEELHIVFSQSIGQIISLID